MCALNYMHENSLHLCQHDTFAEQFFAACAARASPEDLLLLMLPRHPHHMRCRNCHSKAPPARKPHMWVYYCLSFWTRACVHPPPPLKEIGERVCPMATLNCRNYAFFSRTADKTLLCDWVCFSEFNNSFAQNEYGKSDNLYVDLFVTNEWKYTEQSSVVAKPRPLATFTSWISGDHWLDRLVKHNASQFHWAASI